jgi:hypothetical protein
MQYYGDTRIYTRSYNNTEYLSHTQHKPEVFLNQATP